MIRQPLSAIIAALAAGATLATPAASAAELVLTQAPGSNWMVDGGEDSCRLLRTFGEGDDAVTLLLTQWAPGRSFAMVLAGRALRRFDARQPMELQFGDAAGALGLRDTHPVAGTLGEAGQALIFSSVHLTASPPEGQDAPVPDGPWGGAVPALPPAAIDLADRIELVQGRDRLRLSPTRLGDALKVFDQCSQTRLADWGLDAEAHRTMIQSPEPLNFAELSRRVQRYYPMAAQRRGAQADLHMRLLVDEGGIATDCTIIAASQTSTITTNACEHFTAEALFLPALDAAGKPMKSFYTTSILFRIDQP